jgi:hypothetical protein
MLMTGVWFLQESPRWLMEMDRHEEARVALFKLHGNDSNSEHLELEYREIRDAIVAEKTIAVASWKGLLQKPAWRRRLLLGCGIQAFGQLSGINVINYYGLTIYTSLGIDTRTSLMIIGISGSLSIVYCALGLYFLERIGRVKPMIFSAVGCGLALLVNAVLSQYYLTDSGIENPNANALRAMVAMNLVFSFFFTFTGIISWVYPAEIFPVEIRARGNSISTLTNWCLGLLIGQTSPLALANIGFKFFYVFFVFNLIAAASYLFLYPEYVTHSEYRIIAFTDKQAGQEERPLSRWMSFSMIKLFHMLWKTQLELKLLWQASMKSQVWWLTRIRCNRQNQMSKYSSSCWLDL